MAAPIKRACDDIQRCVKEHTEPKQTRVDSHSISDGQNEILSLFLQWTETNNYRLSEKVKVGREGSCAQYGMVAVQDINEGETLFQIPRTSILSPTTCSIAQLLKSEWESLESVSGWVPLLLTLMYEYLNPNSTWRPYLDLVPDFNQLDLPMFWPRSELESELKATGVVEAVKKDLLSISEEFTNIVLPFVVKHKDVFHAKCQDIEFYKRMVAFVMAYSFTEPSKTSDDNDDDSDSDDEPSSPPMMVPMADILNHVAKNNACLNFEKEALKMVSIKVIKKGEEVFNTYGELPNWQLVQMYGFAELYPLNHYDTVEVPCESLMEHATCLQINDKDILEEKRTFLNSQNLLDERSTFVIGVEGILTDEEVEQILKVLCMDKLLFAEHKEKEGWSDVDETENSTNNRFMFDKMRCLPNNWKLLLKKSCENCLMNYSTSSEKDEETFKDLSNITSSRARYSLMTRYGQRQLLQKLLDSLS